MAEHSFAARPGYHLAPRPLPEGGTTFDRLGSGFTLLALDAAEAAEAFDAAARDLGLPLDIVPLARDGAAGDYAAPLILVRPDHFVAWSGDGAADAAGVLRLAAGRAD
ncbi:aromatic-ring hydroxylase C-terminal domain-containing protein [Roseivivax sp. CAU 1761]